MLVTDILKVCGDQHSRGFYKRLVHEVPASLIRAALSETKYRAATRQIKKSKGAYFTDEIMRTAKVRASSHRTSWNEPSNQRVSVGHKGRNMIHIQCASLNILMFCSHF